MPDLAVLLGHQDGEPIPPQRLHHQVAKLAQVPEIIEIVPADGPAVDHLHYGQRIGRDATVPPTDLGNGLLQQHGVHFHLVGRPCEYVVPFVAGHEIIDYDVVDYAILE